MEPELAEPQEMVEWVFHRPLQVRQSVERAVAVVVMAAVAVAGERHPAVVVLAVLLVAQILVVAVAALFMVGQLLEPLAAPVSLSSKSHLRTMPHSHLV